MPQKYHVFYNEIISLIPKVRVFTDPLRTLAYGTDASLYRLIPKIAIKTENEREVTHLLKSAAELDIPITFRAAGTSLCGQGVTDAVLVIAGKSWDKYEILDDGEKIRLQPGLTGEQVNSYLAPYGRRIGPDPSSISAAMIGGIAANNASGMCCGVFQNSYNTLDSMRLILQDGTLLDTSNSKSRDFFCKKRSELIQKIINLSYKVKNNQILVNKIQEKYKIKNTTGYSINALIDFEDPVDIISHLMIGSEGTLGFISQITYQTIVAHPYKATAILIFANTREACNAVTLLQDAPVVAAEMMERSALRSVENKEGMPAYLKNLPDKAAALLIETTAENNECLIENINKIIRYLSGIKTILPFEFTDQEIIYNKIWEIRRGLTVNPDRKAGTTIIGEDIAFPSHQLGAGVEAIEAIMKKYGYSDAIVYGHAMAGNIHIDFTQDFNSQGEIDRYKHLMEDVCNMVVHKFDGSLKAEHGTGRNMAPFVEMEWGRELYKIMQEIKKIFDPKYLLNPGVIINGDPNVYLKNIKPMPAANPIIDKCVECGFCEANCPSKDLTLSPRQRIVVYREIVRLKKNGQNAERLKALQQNFSYLADQTCALDGLCSLNCPVSINTGELIKELRRDKKDTYGCQSIATWIVNNFCLVCNTMRNGLKLIHEIHCLIGTKAMNITMNRIRAFSRNRLPLWNRFMPKGADKPIVNYPSKSKTLKAVYFSGCVSRVMGPAHNDPDTKLLHKETIELLNKSGYEIIFPRHMEKLCCGLCFESKGLLEHADKKAIELEKALKISSEGGKYPILCDTSPCVLRMREVMSDRLQIFEPVEFIYTFLMKKLTFKKLNETVAIHITCSSRIMGLESEFRAVAEACSEDIIIPEKVKCCGFAGDKGFNYPELNKSALKDLGQAVSGKCKAGYSNSRTCEIGLSVHSGIHYKSIINLVNKCTVPKFD